MKARVPVLVDGVAKAATVSRQLGVLDVPACLDDRLPAARPKVDGFEEVVLCAAVGDVVETPTVGAEPDRLVDLLFLVGGQVPQLAAFDVEEVRAQVGVAEEVDDCGAPAVGMPGRWVEQLLLTVEHKPWLALHYVQPVEGHGGGALLVATEEHAASVVGDGTDLVLDVVARGHGARPPHTV